MARMTKLAAHLSFVMASMAFACAQDPRERASEYASDPVPCADDSDCCIVNDGCQSTAYLVASINASTVSSLLASADKTTCDRCMTPMIQASCFRSRFGQPQSFGVCVGERINDACLGRFNYP